MKEKRKLIWKRWILGVLIVLNLVAIFAFSAQPAEKSDHTSNKLSGAVIESVNKDFEKLPPRKQESLIVKLAAPLRKVAHMLEFGVLGILIFLFLLTWRGRVPERYLITLAFVLVYAATDEWHQLFVPGRGGLITDVLIDFAGAFIGCSVTLLIVLSSRSKRGALVEKPTITRYRIPFDARLSGRRIAVAADIHGNEHDLVLDALEREAPDIILIPGDLMRREALGKAESRGYEFLRACVKLAPTYYSLGNHELACYHSGNPRKRHSPTLLTDEIRARIAETGAVLLEDDCVRVGELTLCGLSSGIRGVESYPDTDALARFAKADGYRILLCHHPEYFVPYVSPTDIELIVCGHAHGGQWRLFGRGIYAPGQGFFPKYTAGVIDGRCIISRGLGTHSMIPRIFNHPELVVIEAEEAIHHDLARD